MRLAREPLALSALMRRVSLEKDEQLVDKVGIERVDLVRAQVKPIEQHDVNVKVTRADRLPVELGPPAMIEIGARAAC